ncbi:hydroxyacid dehydrogenase [Knoellia remsis]|uniref:hydroxyacid dehydrogenase n=1 Tax=Knoellia remsis TaxID=407159 RepID=UPI001C43FBA8|nr:hydroxyacid dehydrogenase [Knoellia remsis]
MRTAIVMPRPTADSVLDERALTTLADNTELLRDDDGAPLLVTDFATAPWNRLASAEAIVTGWGSPFVDAAVLARFDGLRLVAHAAGTLRPYLAPDVWRAGVRVSNAADANAVPVAEFTLATVILAGKRTARYVAAYRETGELRPDIGDGLWVGNHGLTIGVVGASRIGRLVLERLRALDVRVLVADPFLTADDAAALGAELVTLPDLLGRSHVVTVHAPELPSTRHLIDADGLAAMPDGAVLVNTARGSLVDTEALLPHVVSGRLDAWLDVTDPEPLPVGHPFFTLPNVVLTPHLAGSLGRESHRLGQVAAAEVARCAAGEALHHEVLAADLDRIA